MAKITVELDRQANYLWTKVDGIRTEAIWNVTGVEKRKGDYLKIMCNGKGIGVIFDVEDIEEEW